MAAPSFIGRSRFSMVCILADTLAGSIPRISRRIAKLSKTASYTSKRRRLSNERDSACRIVERTRAMESFPNPGRDFNSAKISAVLYPRSRRLKIWPEMLMGLSTV